MHHHDQPDLPPGLHAGRLEGISVPDLLWAVCSRRMTGVLELSRESCHKTIYVQNGQIVFAASGDPDDRLGELLLRDGSINLDQLEEALSRQEPGKRLGALLVEGGHLSPDKLVAGVLAQVERIVLGTFTWEVGEYRFDEGPLPTQEVITLGMKTGEILLRGIRRIRSFSRIRRSVGAPRTCYRVTHGFRHALDGLSLSDGEEMLLSRLDGLGETVENLCREVFLSNYEIYQALWAMRVLGVIEEVERPVEVDDAVDEGDVDSNGIAPVLVRLVRAGETGVLHVIRGSAERTIHIKEGQCVFATSNDFEDGLLAYLLRRGVISLRDREETAKRLLSNKRVGTILRELGVIDEADLRAMVREQLSEIIYDTLTWESGEYTFVSGELPTIEEITLDTSIETLVANGLRRSQSWSRVFAGCGGSQVAISLAPEYLEVLDRMNASTKEWEVVSRIKEPRTLHAITRDTDMSDFAVCQTLWVLRTLGAIESRPLEPADVAASEAEDEAHGPAVGSVEPAETEQADAEPAETGQAETDEESVVLAVHDEPGFDGEIDGATPVFDSPGDATTFIPREEVEAALRQPPEEETPFELTHPFGETFDEPLEADRPLDGWGDDDDGEPEHGTGDTQPGADWKEAIDAARRRAADADEAGGDGTADVPHVEVEAALASDTGTAVEAEGREDDSDDREDDPDWIPPADLERQIARFNARQRVIYRMVRAEVGAGAANFIRSCTGRVAGYAPDPFSGADLQADGSWDAESLRRVCRELRIEDPAPDYERVIDAEIEALSAHIGERRAHALREQVERLD